VGKNERGGSINKKARLREAIKTGEVLEITYQGGSQPGTCRAISPIRIENDKVRARCLNSRAVKLFVIKKIVIINNVKQTELSEWSVSTQPSHHYKSISELLEQKRDVFIGLGWHIESDEDHLSLHKRWKNGKPHKGSDISLDYEEYTYDLVVDMDGKEHEENLRKKTRPWIVRGKNKNTRTFGKLDAAAEVFIELANLLLQKGKEK
jgi:hypothetical protein